jgi:hypothetical protein
MAIDSRTISNWVRQARYRAKKHNIYSDLEVADVLAILANSTKCGYCDTDEATTIDCPFPLKDGGPNVPANIVLSCKACKTKKNNNDIVWLFLHGFINKDLYVVLVESLCKRRGGELIKTHLRRATGISE